MLSKLKVQQEAINAQVIELSAEYDAKRAQLQENDTYNQLSSLESKLKQVEGVTFGMKDCKFLFTSQICLLTLSFLDISSKTAESNYKPLASHVLKMMDEVNSQLIKISQMAPAR